MLKSIVICCVSINSKKEGQRRRSGYDHVINHVTHEPECILFHDRFEISIKAHLHDTISCIRLSF